jgi:hypothetical protein
MRKEPPALRKARRIARILETVGTTGLDVLRVVLPALRMILAAAKRIRGN